MLTDSYCGQHGPNVSITRYTPDPTAFCSESETEVERDGKIVRSREAAEAASLDCVAGRIYRQIDMREPYVSAIEERVVVENRREKTGRALFHANDPSAARRRVGNESLGDRK